MEIEQRGMVDHPATAPDQGGSLNPSEGVGEFASQYSVFAAGIRRLQEAHQELAGRYAALQDELAVANERLRHTLAERERSAAYLESILGSMPSGVVAVDTEGRVQLYNRAAEELFGRSAREVLGKPYQSALPLAQPSALGALRGPRALQDGEKMLPRTAGTPLPVAASTSLLIHQDGRVNGAVEILTDLSRLRSLEGEIARVRVLAALGEMAATVAHEIRNPLGGIAGFAALLAREFEAGDDRRRLADNIVKGCDNLNRIVTNLLRYAQPLRLEKRPCDLGAELTEEIALVESTFTREGRDVRIERQLDASIGTISVDPVQMRMALHNLLLNAAEATFHGRVECGLCAQENEAGEGWLHIWVADDGPGVPAPHLDKIFNPFFTTKDKGTGLGLATVRKIIEAHGGQVRCVHPPEGGARFDLHIPRE
jgi:PAS domain S-box-containing protein